MPNRILQAFQTIGRIGAVFAARNVRIPERAAAPKVRIPERLIAAQAEADHLFPKRRPRDTEQLRRRLDLP